MVWAASGGQAAGQPGGASAGYTAHDASGATILAESAARGPEQPYSGRHVGNAGKTRLLESL